MTRILATLTRTIIKQTTGVCKQTAFLLLFVVEKPLEQQQVTAMTKPFILQSPVAKETTEIKQTATRHYSEAFFSSFQSMFC